jgi:hypothetical protein
MTLGELSNGEYPWRRSLSDEEFLWLRLFRMLDEVQSTIARLEQDPSRDHAASLAALDRLRTDLVAAIRLAVRDEPQG